MEMIDAMLFTLIMILFAGLLLHLFLHRGKR